MLYEDKFFYEEKFFSAKRIRHLLFMLAATYAATAAICLIRDVTLDVAIAVCALDLIYFTLLVLGLAVKRRRGFFSHRQVGYGKLAFAYTVCCILLVGFSLMPEFTRPIVLCAFLLYMFSQESIAVYITLYFAALLCILCSSTIFELSSLVLIASGSVFLLTLIREKKQQLYVCFMLLALSILLPCLFYYLAFGGIDISSFALDCAGAALSCLAALILYSPLKTYVSNEEEAILEVIVMPNYVLVRDIKAFSRQEYDHAVKVMNLSRKCAIACGADERVCAAGGFYYRVGVMEGEPFVENGVRLALNRGFPEAVIRILAEYDGEECLPSSVESAIVHMVNTVVTKVEELQQDSMQASWNQNVVIYQTLNEISASGFYDKSALTMNQFLKTRDILAAEEKLL